MSNATKSNLMIRQKGDSYELYQPNVLGISDLVLRKNMSKDTAEDMLYRAHSSHESLQSLLAEINYDKLYCDFLCALFIARTNA